MAWHRGPAGVIGARRVSEGLPGSWEVPSSPARSGGRRSAAQGPPAAAPGDGGSEESGARWYRQAKATKRGGTDGGTSELLVLPTNPGNRPEGPGGGKGEPVNGTEGGKDAGNEESLKRLYETSTDSRSGEAEAGGGAHGPR